MTLTTMRAARFWALILACCLTPVLALAAPFAAYVMDGRTGKPVYAQNHDTRLHPASLTKMMTLYMAFAAIERGQVRLDSRFPITTHAAAEPPSRLGLKPGQKIELRYLIRAAAIKSANDAATAIGEGLAGSEAAFAAQMTATARALGMRNTAFRNANGLTEAGHYSTAEDMTLLGRRLFYDFPQYYALFSRRSADAGIAQVQSTNRQFLNDYPGADGIKTGYTRAAGFNLTASAARGNKRIIATVFGGTSTAQRNAVMKQLLDAGFGRAPNRVREVVPEKPQLMAQKVTRRASVDPSPAATAVQPQRMVLDTSAPPRAARRSAGASLAAAPAAAPSGGRDALAEAVRAAVASDAAPAASTPRAQTASAQTANTKTASTKTARALTTSARPFPRPDGRGTAVAAAMTAPETPAPTPVDATRAGIAAAVLAAVSAPAARPSDVVPTEDPAAVAADAVAPTVRQLTASQPPRPRSPTVILAAMGEGDRGEAEATEIVTRPRAGGTGWAVDLGLFETKAKADRRLLEIAIQGGDAFARAGRGVSQTAKGWQAVLSGVPRAAAERVCDRLTARQEPCTVRAR